MMANLHDKTWGEIRARLSGVRETLEGTEYIVLYDRNSLIQTEFADAQIQSELFPKNMLADLESLIADDGTTNLEGFRNYLDKYANSYSFPAGKYPFRFTGSTVLEKPLPVKFDISVAHLYFKYLDQVSRDYVEEKKSHEAVLFHWKPEFDFIRTATNYYLYAPVGAANRISGLGLGFTPQSSRYGLSIFSLASERSVEEISEKLRSINLQPINVDLKDHGYERVKLATSEYYNPAVLDMLKENFSEKTLKKLQI